MLDGAESFHDALIDVHLQYDIIQLDRELVCPINSSYLPDQAALGDSLSWTALREYVRGGGKLLASGCSSLWDEERGASRWTSAWPMSSASAYQREAGSEFVYLRLDEERIGGSG